MTNRRTFVKAAAMGLAAGVSFPRPSLAAPSDKIQFGFIGLGRQGTSRLNEFIKHPDVVAAAVCDLDENHVKNAAGIVEKVQGHKPEIFHDFRKLLARKDIDAVMIATPDHWHTMPVIAACQAGKDV